MMVSRQIAVLPVWRSPMISSRWPRPIGIMESIALMPVWSGTFTGARSMMPGAGHSTGLGGVDGALAVDRLAQRVYDAAEHRFTDRNLDDALGALYRVALTDILVGTQDNGADEILLKVLRHAVYAARKLEQLTRHAVLQTMDMRDTVAYGDDRTDVGQLDLALVVRDLLLDNITDLFRA